jgi:(4S)-4-hydroxy-5-phosphonooxypentane-2,3-dione isomerase
VGEFVLVVHLQIKPGAADKFMPLALENAKATRETEAGCRQFDVMVDTQDAHQVLFYEVYDSEAAFQAHQQTPHFKKYFDTALQHLDTRTRSAYARVAP